MRNLAGVALVFLGVVGFALGLLDFSFSKQASHDGWLRALGVQYAAGLAAIALGAGIAGWLW